MDGATLPGSRPAALPGRLPLSEPSPSDEPPSWDEPSPSWDEPSPCDEPPSWDEPPSGDEPSPSCDEPPPCDEPLPSGCGSGVLASGGDWTGLPRGWTSPRSRAARPPSRSSRNRSYTTRAGWSAGAGISLSSNARRSLPGEPWKSSASCWLELRESTVIPTQWTGGCGTTVVISSRASPAASHPAWDSASGPVSATALDPASRPCEIRIPRYC